MDNQIVLNGPALTVLVSLIAAIAGGVTYQFTASTGKVPPWVSWAAGAFVLLLIFALGPGLIDR